MSKPFLIAIIDDDEAIRVATASLLRSFGYDTRVFASAEEFLDSGAEREAACLLTDVQMPGIGGIELQRLLAERSCPFPVVLMTAFGGSDLRHRALAAGAFRVLDKPFDGETIFQCLREALLGN
ncbi:response regulator receiver [Skermanella stibiiresistens SB22]|uniref:Response regulator receiver n=1 Tax=Skermanella stibiiresistens SB22 TaxID=1385369 RepID=W9H048_9PROT|nr:response regulator [Skermanella stibiiresistens]EWY39560.1 response regulator receiver [Skermanella stibiiresistens SB22]